jgi:ComF family protein
MTGSPSSFQWPPHPVEASADAAATQRARAIARDAMHPRRPPAPQNASWWSTVERTFLGVTRGTWQRRTAEAAWSRDSLDAYCARCGQTLGALTRPNHELISGETSAEVVSGACPICAYTKLPWQRVVRMSEYEGVVREAILEVKFSAWRRLGEDLARDFAPCIAEALEFAGIARQNAMLIPVPTSRWRRLTRGIDHTKTISRILGKELGVPVAPMLHRLHRPPQACSSLDQRRRNVVRSMSVRAPGLSPMSIAGKTILLVDDVMTTGATMREACRALGDWTHKVGGSQWAQGPRAGVWAAALAVTCHTDANGQPGHLSA